jgi:ABC-type spermidine/putrescine transport system permease subunit I
MTQGLPGGAAAAPPGPSSPETHGGLKRQWPLAPLGVLLLLFFFLPIALMVVYSFWTTDNNFRTVPDWTLKNYARFFTNESYLRTFGKTLLMAALVTVAGIFMAVPYAYFLVRYTSKRWQRIILVLTIVPFWTSYLLRVYAWEAILGEQGVLNKVLMGLGLIEQPSRLFVYNNNAVFLVLVYVYFPFAALAIYASLEKFDFDLLRAAQDLGARPSTAFVRILLPIIKPGLITACIFVFVPILGEYLTPNLVGGTEGVLISNLIINFFRGAQIPAGAAPAFLIALFVTVVLVVFRRYLRVEDVVTRG